MSKTLGKPRQPLKIGVIIPTVYKADWSDVRAAIQSLVPAPSQAQKVRLSFWVFIDAAAPGVDCKKISRLLSKQTQVQVRVGWSHVSVGFTGAVNQSVQLLTAERKFDWLLVFNDDAQARSNFWAILTHLQRQQHGVVSCGVANWHGQVESVGLRQGRWGGTLPITVQTRTLVPQIHQSHLFSGTCFFVATKTTTQLLTKFGFFFFPLFFAYAEDFELSVKLHRLGIPVSVDVTVRVKHKGSQTSKRGSAWQLFYGLRNDVFVHVLHQSISVRALWYGVRFLAYIVLLSWYKGYLVLPFKIVGSILKQSRVLHFWRQQYDQKLPYSYSF